MEICIGVLFIAVVLGGWSAVSAIKQTNQAKKVYLESLEKLKNSPENADLVQKTLELGRAYVKLNRISKGVPIVNEISLMNDINAACTSANQNIFSNSSIEEKLHFLNELLEKGLITDIEYRAKKTEILSRI